MSAQTSPKHSCTTALFCLLACLFCLPSALYAATETNNGTIINWNGTAADDLYTNNGKILGNWDMTQGGSDQLVNNGSVTGTTTGGANDDTVTVNDGATFGGLVDGGAGDDTLVVKGVSTFSGVFGAGIDNFEYGEITPDGTTTIDGITNFVDQADLIGGTLQIDSLLSTGLLLVRDGGTVNISGIGALAGDIDSDANGLTLNLEDGGAIAGWVYSMGPSQMNLDGAIFAEVVGNWYGNGDVNIVIGETGHLFDILGGCVAATGDVYINNAGTVEGPIFGSDSSTGDVTIINSGEALWIIGMTSAETPTVATGNVSMLNTETGSTVVFNGIWVGRGDVTMVNNGTVALDFVGNLEGWGNVVLTNTGTVLAGDFVGVQDGEGNATMTNTGTVGGGFFGVFGGTGNAYMVNTSTGTVGDTMVGADQSTADVTIVNHGDVRWDMCGQSDGTGDVYLLNTGTVATDGGHLYGIWDGSGSVTLINSGTVGGNLYGNLDGTGNCDITNSGTVAGHLIAGSGNDSVTLTETSSIGGNVDGGNGTDTLIFNVANSLGITDTSPYINFEHARFTGNGLTSLSDSFVFSGSASVDGKLNINNGGSLRAGSANVDGTLNINNGGSLTSGSVDINGSLSIAAGGAMTSNSFNVRGYGNINGQATASTTTVGGHLVVNGALTSPSVGVSSGGTLSGNGTINGNLSNNGIVAPGNSIGTLVVSGNFTNQAGGSYYCEINANGQSDKIIAGSVTINGGTLVTSLPVGLYASGTCWTIVSATGGVSGNFDTVTNLNSSATLELETVANGVVVELDVVRKPMSDLAANKTQAQVGAALDATVPYAEQQQDDITNLLMNMDWAYDQAQIDDALAALAPSIYDAFGGAGHNAARMFGLAMSDRMDNLRLRRGLGLGGPRASEGPLLAMADESQAAGMMASGGVSRDWSVWARAMGDWSDASGSGGMPGYETNTGGAVFGADGNVLPWLTTGLVVGYSTTDISWDSGAHSGDQKGMHYGAYASARWGGFYADGTVAYAAYNNDAKRAIEFDSVNATASSDFDSSIWSVGFGGGYDLHTANIVWGPVLSLAYADYRQDGFSESGAGGFSLDVRELDQSAWSGSAGIRAAGLWAFGSVNLMPKAGLYWLHSFDDDPRVITATFRNYGSASPMNITGLEPYSDALAANLGFSLLMAGRLSAFVDYSYLHASDYSGHTVTAGLDWMF